MVSRPLLFYALFPMLLGNLFPAMVHLNFYRQQSMVCCSYERDNTLYRLLVV